MTKSELITVLAMRNDDLTKAQIHRLVNLFFKTITEALGRDDRIELRGFGTFYTKLTNARTGRNPKTGEKAYVEAKRVPCFKAGKDLKFLKLL